MVSISCLPDNIISDIVSLLDQNSITNFCLTCSKFNKIGNAQLKKRIVVVPKTKNNLILDDFELLQTFTYGFTKVKEDHFTELYSRDFFKNTKELACLELYKRKKLQDYVVKLPYLENFFTFDSKSYYWYEDFIQYCWTSDVNIAHQYQNRIMQRSVIPLANQFPIYNRRKPLTRDQVEGSVNESDVSDTEDSDSETEVNSFYLSLEQELLESKKLLTRIDDKLEYFKFSKYRKYKKLKYLYAPYVQVNELNFNLKLITALFLIKPHYIPFTQIAYASSLDDMRENDAAFFESFDDYFCYEGRLEYHSSYIPKLPIEWKYLKELRLYVEGIEVDFSQFGACLESLEILYIQDINGFFNPGFFDFILKIKDNLLQQVTLFSVFHLWTKEAQVPNNVKELVKKVLAKQRYLLRFTIRCSKNVSYDLNDILEESDEPQ